MRICTTSVWSATGSKSAYENKRDDDRVIQEVNQTIKGNNAPAMATLNHANLLYGTRNYDRAIPYYDRALKLQPGNAEALTAAAAHWQWSASSRPRWRIATKRFA